MHGDRYSVCLIVSATIVLHCIALAYLGGVKGNLGTIGVNGKVKLNDCDAVIDDSTKVQSIAKWAHDAGKSIGLVTTTRVTHASPAGELSAD